MIEPMKPYTEADYLILESYKNFVDGLSKYLGKSYEIVVHSLEDLEHSVIKIINGYHTGRSEGSPITDLALSMLEKIKTQKESTSISYYTKNKKSEMLKSTTIAIYGDQNRIIGVICINFYMNTPFADILNNFIPESAMNDNSQIAEILVDNVDDLIKESVNNVRNKIYMNKDIPATHKNKEIIRVLYDSGVFNLKDAVVKTASLMGISKNTVYMHIRNLKD